MRRRQSRTIAWHSAISPRFQIHAPINAVHADAPTAAQTDWWQILHLYNQLLIVAPSPFVDVNRAVAVAEVEGPDAALTLLDGLDLENYYLFHAVSANMLRRLGRNDEAAIARTNNLTEREYMQRRLDGLAFA